MPTIAVKKVEIEKLLHKEYEEQAFNDILFDFGLEIDEITQEDGFVVYKIEIPANRYDLLCTQGLVHALRSYLFGVEFRDVEIKKGNYSIILEDREHRGEVAAAVIKNYKFNEHSYQNFISFQEKLCGSVGRNRAIVAIGTHDLSKVSFPVVYKSVEKKEVNFVPLRHTSSVNGADLQDLLSSDNNLSKYFRLVRENEFNVFVDAKGQILSIPPIINSEDTKISQSTTDILIEVTGTNFHKVNTALKMILNAFRTDEVYSVEVNSISTPVQNTKTYHLTVEEIAKELNITIGADDLIGLLTKMMYRCERVNDSEIVVYVPEARQDVLHKVDLIEDVAVAYGFNNFSRSLPDINTIGLADPFNKFTDKIRMEMALLGFLEVHTLALVSKTENLFDSENAIEVDNFKSLECEVGRTSLLPGLLKSVACNLHTKIPMKIFECGDVLILEESHDIGARNLRMLSCLLVSNASQLEEVQGPLTLLLNKCGIHNFEYIRKDYENRYLKNQSASIVISGEEVGSVGVVDPKVLKIFKLPYPGSAFELNLEKLFNLFIKFN
ncbi:putative phenylalanine--tRNA ligase beta subunit [Nosema granulosis]|uniref:phenylalanine--tRNA ligase n=1 Tax=Nosema granulosis TaxID=83296 RepID=A0A9P6GY00_9MICR|nr:putative phenylalanine--tRNA ligase beta subunit [Nosema granulosis]